MKKGIKSRGENLRIDYLGVHNGLHPPLAGLIYFLREKLFPIEMPNLRDFP